MVRIDARENRARILEAARQAFAEDGGREIACGWCADRWGVIWQVTPVRLGELLSDPDPDRASRTMIAMQQMVKLDIAALEAAADGS